MNFGYPKVQAGNSHCGVAQIRKKKKKRKEKHFWRKLTVLKNFPHTAPSLKRFTILKSKMKHMTMTQIALLFFNLLEFLNFLKLFLNILNNF